MAVMRSTANDSKVALDEEVEEEEEEEVDVEGVSGRLSSSESSDVIK